MIDKKTVDQIWEYSKYKQSTTLVYPDGSTSFAVGTNYDDKKAFEIFKRDKYQNTYPKRKRDIFDILTKKYKEYCIYWGIEKN